MPHTHTPAVRRRLLARWRLSLSGVLEYAPGPSTGVCVNAWQTSRHQAVIGTTGLILRSRQTHWQPKRAVNPNSALLVELASSLGALMSSLPAERRCLGKVRVLCQECVIEAVVLSLLSERKSLNLCSHLTHIHTWIRQVMSRWALVYWTNKTSSKWKCNSKTLIRRKMCLVFPGIYLLI